MNKNNVDCPASGPATSSAGGPADRAAFHGLGPWICDWDAFNFTIEKSIYFPFFFYMLHNLHTTLPPPHLHYPGKLLGSLLKGHSSSRPFLPLLGACFGSWNFRIML